MSIFQLDLFEFVVGLVCAKAGCGIVGYLENICCC